MEKYKESIYIMNDDFNNLYNFNLKQRKFTLNDFYKPRNIKSFNKEDMH